MPRGMMPYPPPYGMSVYPHGMPPGYPDPQQPGMGSSGDPSGGMHLSASAPGEPCAPASSLGVMSQGGAGAGGSVESLGGMNPMGPSSMGRTYGDPSAAAQGGGPNM